MISGNLLIIAALGVVGIAAAGAAAIQRTMFIRLLWPEILSYYPMRRLVGRYFKHHGWHIRTLESQDYDFIASNRAGEFAIRCLPTGLGGKDTLPFDFTEVRKFGGNLSLILLSADPVDNISVVKALLRNVFLLHYKSLSRLVALDPATPAAVFSLFSEEATSWLSESDAVVSTREVRSVSKMTMLMEHARKKTRDGDFLAARQIWETLRSVAPSSPEAYAGGMQVSRVLADLDEAERLGEVAIKLFPEDPNIAIEWARSAHSRKDFLLAAERWEGLRLRFPERPDGWVGGAQALRSLRRFAEAGEFALAGQERHPKEASLAIEYARAAFEMRDLSAAAERWSSMQERFPDHPQGYVGRVQALRVAGDLNEAEDAANLAVERFPSILEALLEHARVADRRQDWREAGTRWARVVAVSATSAEGAFGHGHALRMAAQNDLAESALRIYAERFPRDPRFLIELASCITAPSDWAEASERWGAVLRRFPSDAAAWSAAIRFFTRLERLNEAEDLAIAVPNDVAATSAVMIEVARVAARRRDWPEALRRWEAALQRHPSNTEIQDGLGVAKVQIQLSLADLGERTSASPTIGRGAERLSSDDLSFMQDFESLGGNCEFGMVQGMAGAHGLGLLRWCALRPSQLEQMLLTSFDGVGLPENTSVELHDNGEYMLRDNRYFYMHTFIKRGDAEPDKLLLQMCRRLAFLKAKIIEDLNLGEKTFVYKTPEGNRGYLRNRR